jgi:prepilin-type N-terminal cleavage/methylation domain-containing protein
MASKLQRHRRSAFTLVEVLVSIAVLALLVALIGQLFNNTSAASTISTNHLEADARVRLLFTRMAADFSHIVKRPDVDYFLKPELNPASPTSVNDQMAFYSNVPGYSPAGVTTPDNVVSLVAYRLNSTGTAPCIERLGTALSWGGGSSTIYPVIFAPPGSSMISTTFINNWKTATYIPASTSTSDPGYDPNYETIVPNAFRFEYYYLLNSGVLSATPWDPSIPNHVSASGLQDVAGIGVVVAVTDRKASAIATTASLTTLASSLDDWSTTYPKFGQLQSKWQSEVTASSLAPVVKDGIRVYEQLFPINTPSQ